MATDHVNIFKKIIGAEVGFFEGLIIGPVGGANYGINTVKSAPIDTACDAILAPFVDPYFVISSTVGGFIGGAVQGVNLGWEQGIALKTLSHIAAKVYKDVYGTGEFLDTDMQQFKFNAKPKHHSRFMNFFKPKKERDPIQPEATMLARCQ